MHAAEVAANPGGGERGAVARGIHDRAARWPGRAAIPTQPGG